MFCDECRCDYISKPVPLNFVVTFTPWWIKLHRGVFISIALPGDWGVNVSRLTIKYAKLMGNRRVGHVQTSHENSAESV